VLGPLPSPVDIDVNTGVASGHNAENFSSYLGIVAPERLSILINSRDDVSKVDQNILWEDFIVSFTLLSLSYNAF